MMLSLHRGRLSARRLLRVWSEGFAELQLAGGEMLSRRSDSARRRPKLHGGAARASVCVVGGSCSSHHPGGGVAKRQAHGVHLVRKRASERMKGVMCGAVWCLRSSNAGCLCWTTET